MKRFIFSNLILGILNVITGIILSMFVILMQNLIALIMGILYIIYGIAMLCNKMYKKLLFWALIPFTILFSLQIILLIVDKNMPEYLQIPLHIGLIITLPLWILTFTNIWLLKKS